MQRYKLTIEYDGSAFCGWQKQKNLVSVQETLENAIKIMTKHEVKLIGSGRTDAGVHALNQVAHFDSEAFFDEFKLTECINNNVRHLPVVATKVEKVPDTFHARKSANKRHYVYKIINRIPKLTLDKNFVLHVRSKLDTELMDIAIKTLIGTYDFSAFRDAQCQSFSPIKTLYDAYIKTQDSLIEIHFIGSSFLHHQVRNMVGTLLLVGLKRITLDDFANIFKSKDRKNAGPTLPPQGLYLFKVHY